MGVLSVLFFLVFLPVVISSSLSQIKEITRPIISPKQVDFGVEDIYAHGCACDLPGIDALYFNKVQVEISANIKFTVEDSAVIGILKVSYFDLMKVEPNPGRLCCRLIYFVAARLIW